MAVRIGELLLKEKRITPEQLQEALTYQKANGGKLGFNLVKLGFVKDEEITALLSKQYGVPSINLTQFEIDAAVIKLIPAETAQKYQIIPLSRAGATLTIAMTAPTNGFARDIHIEPYETEFRVRYRIDGILYNIMSPPMKMRDAITSRIKIMAKLDIAEKRLPQDGRIKIRFADNGNSKDIDFRVSCLPTLFGEKIVMRILDKDKLMLDMTKLGFEQESLSRFEAAINKPWGMVLVTGPTGSGKTNTLYSSISRINTPETNIMTADDPVEFNLVGVNQVQARESSGL